MPKISPSAALAAAILALPFTPAAGAQDLHLNFDVYGSGIFLAGGTLRLDRLEGRYAAELSVKGGPLVDLITRWSYEAGAEGLLTEAGPAPREYRSERRLRRRHETRHLSYGSDGSIAVVDTPPQSEEDAEAVPPEERPGTLDPLSATVAIMDAAERTGCSGHVPVFDGRRRYDVVAEASGADVLSASRRASYGGPAQRCSITLRPVAGFESDRDEGDFFEYGKDREATVWFASAGPKGEQIPVRARIDMELSSFVVHLTMGEPR